VITKKKHVLLIDTAIFGDRNEIEEAAEMFLKYKDLAIEIQHMWNVKTNITSNDSGKWNDMKIMQKISEQHNTNYRKQPNWVLQTGFGKCHCKSAERSHA
jgi:hypothetical protein